MYVKDEHTVKQSIINDDCVKVSFNITLNKSLKNIAELVYVELVYDKLDDKPWQAYLNEADVTIVATTLDDLICSIINFIKTGETVVDVEFKEISILQ